MKNPTEISDHEAIRAMAMGSAIADLVRAEPPHLSGAALGYAFADWLYQQAPDDAALREKIVDSTLRLVAKVIQAHRDADADAARAPQP
jgi:hypothetical protein